MVLVDASSVAASAAEDGRVSPAIWGLVCALLHAGTQCNRDRLISAADTDHQFSNGRQRAAAVEGGSRRVRRPLRSDCRLEGRSDQENLLRNSERQGESH